MNKPKESFEMSYHLHRPWADILFETIFHQWFWRR